MGRRHLAPGWHEPFHWQSLLGVLLIVAGVLTIFWPVKRLN
jgi:undecaprenyl phosphate-alpha-L-ara4N flippase subunit ArnF